MNCQRHKDQKVVGVCVQNKCYLYICNKCVLRHNNHDLRFFDCCQEYLINKTILEKIQQKLQNLRDLFEKFIKLQEVLILQIMDSNNNTTEFLKSFQNGYCDQRSSFIPDIILLTNLKRNKITNQIASMNKQLGLQIKQNYAKSADIQFVTYINHGEFRQQEQQFQQEAMKPKVYREKLPKLQQQQQQ